MSMYCPKCGRPIPSGGVCPCQQQGAPAYGTAPQGTTDNRKIFSILAYIGVLWIVGLVASPEKHDARVRFHVGQGMILFLCFVAVSIALGLLGGLVIGLVALIPLLSGIFSALFGLLQFCVWALYVVLAVMGIINVTKGEQKPLPLVGLWAFYR